MADVVASAVVAVVPTQQVAPAASAVVVVPAVAQAAPAAPAAYFFSGRRVINMPMAWIKDDTVRDVAPGDPAELYHPDMAALFATEVPDGIVPGAVLVNGVWTNPTPPSEPSEPPAATYPKVSPVEFKLLFTSAERIAIKASTDAVVLDFMEIVNDPRLTTVDLGLASTQQGVAYLASVGLIGEARVAEILAGVVQ